jgi:hypothetical protein
MNAASPKPWVAAPVAEMIRNRWRNDVDLSHFEQPGRDYDSVRGMSRIETEIGFVAEKTPEHDSDR